MVTRTVSNLSLTVDTEAANSSAARQQSFHVGQEGSRESEHSGNDRSDVRRGVEEKPVSGAAVSAAAMVAGTAAIWHEGGSARTREDRKKQDPANGENSRSQSERVLSVAAAPGRSRSPGSGGDFSRAAPPSKLPAQSAQNPSPPYPRGADASSPTNGVGPLDGTTPRDLLTLGGGVLGVGGGSGSQQRQPGTPMSSGLMAMRSRLIKRWNSPRFMHQHSLGTPASSTPSGYFTGANFGISNSSASLKAGDGVPRPLGSDGSTSSRTPSRKGGGGGSWLGRKGRDPPEPSSAPPPPPSFWDDNKSSASGSARDRRRRSNGTSRSPNLRQEYCGRSSESLMLATPSWLKGSGRSHSSSALGGGRVASPVSTSGHERRESALRRTLNDGGGGASNPGGRSLEAAAAANGLFLSGIALDPRWAPEYPPQTFSGAGATKASNNASAVVSASAGEGNGRKSSSGAVTTAGSLASSKLSLDGADSRGGSSSSIEAIASVSATSTADPELLDRALTAPAVAGPRPGSGKWPGIAVPPPSGAGGRPGAGTMMTRSTPLLASSGSWAEAPDDVALTKKFRVSLMFYTKVGGWVGG